MNSEKIKELAEKAGYLPDMFGIGHWDMKECHKFAELIVKECTRSIDGEIDRLMEYYKSLNESEECKREDIDLCIEKCYDIIEMLKIDFGIE